MVQHLTDWGGSICDTMQNPPKFNIMCGVTKWNLLLRWAWKRNKPQGVMISEVCTASRKNLHQVENLSIVVLRTLTVDFSSIYDDGRLKRWKYHFITVLNSIMSCEIHPLWMTWLINLIYGYGLFLRGEEKWFRRLMAWPHRGYFHSYGNLGNLSPFLDCGRRGWSLRFERSEPIEYDN